MPVSLYSSLSHAVEAGVSEPLPMPWKALAEIEVAVRRGQVHLWAGAPGMGKTAIALNYLLHPDVQREVATLYFSPDSDVMTIAPRTLALMQGRRVRDVFSAFESQKADEYIEVAKELRHVQWCFEYPLEDKVIDLEIEAYQVIHGHNPDLIILDNIRDVFLEDADGSDWGQQKATVDYFKQIAYKTGAAVILLHHLTGGKENGDTVPKLGDIENKLGKNVRQALLFFSPDEYTIGIRCEKNSSGAKHFGDDYLPMGWDRPTQRIG